MKINLMAKQFSEKLLSDSISLLLEKKASIEDKKKQYETLESDLIATSKVSTKEVLVPLSSVGFIRGKLKHTNEVYVHLGSNYFV